LSLAVWCWVLSTPDAPNIYRSLPYTAQSPTLYRRIKYDEAELWNEIERIAEENKKFPTGQWMYLCVPLFGDVNYFIEDWMWDMIQEYNWIAKFNLSLGDLDTVSTHRLDCFTLIDNEIINAKNYKNGR